MPLERQTYSEQVVEHLEEGRKGFQAEEMAHAKQSHQLIQKPAISLTVCYQVPEEAREEWTEIGGGGILH